jgi:hypothetical protein
MTQFTKGPWVKEVSKSRIDILTNGGWDKGQPWIASVFVNHVDVSQEAGEANAHLIAAAPDMYEALEQAQKVLAMFIEPNAIQQTTVINAYAKAIEAEYKARKALAKARGEK